MWYLLSVQIKWEIYSKLKVKIMCMYDYNTEPSIAIPTYVHMQYYCTVWLYNSPTLPPPVVGMDKSNPQLM